MNTLGQQSAFEKLVNIQATKVPRYVLQNVKQNVLAETHRAILRKSICLNKEHRIMPSVNYYR